MKKFLSSTLALVMLLGMMTFNVSAAGEPKVKIIATETETTVNVSVKVSGNVDLQLFDVFIGYKNAKLEVAGSATVLEPTGWTLTNQDNYSVHNSSTDSVFQVTNAWDGKLNDTGSPVTVTDGTDVEVASFVFTKKDTIAAGDIYYNASGFKTSVVTTRHTAIFNGETEVTAKTTADLVEVTFIPFNAGGGEPQPPTGNEDISTSISTVQQNVVFSTDDIVNFDLNVEKFADVKNFMVDFSYDQTKLILQNSEADEDVYTLDDDGSGNVRMIVTLPVKKSSATANKLYSLKFKMKDAAKNTSTTITLKKFAVGIAVDKGTEIISAIGTATAAINMNEYVFSYDINGDSKTVMGDLVYAEGFLGSKDSDANWTTAKKADANGDGKVSIADFINIAIYIALNK